MYLLGPRVRRKILKQSGNEISIPLPRQNNVIKKEIRERIASGVYDLGEPVLQTTCTKFVLTKSGSLEKKASRLTARKYSFKEIRTKSLLNNKKFLKVRSDESYANMSNEDAKAKLNEFNETNEDPKSGLKNIERTRNWLIWHDHSGIGNHGLMLFLLRELYDPAIHMTNDEYKRKSGLNVDVQSVVEEPHLYMMGFSSCTDEDQLMFIPTRRECLQSLSQPIEIDGVPIVDKMRFMNGDNPSIEFEDGTQKGGHRGCSGCDGDMRRAGDYDYMAARNYKSLEEKLQLVTSGVLGKRDKVCPFKKLKVDEIRRELKQRKVYVRPELKKPELQEKLTDILGGSTRVPALLFGTDNHCTLDSLNLKDYEVLFFEPLHCCLNHVSHLLQELPHHITDVDALLVINETASLTLGKDKVRCTDYRKALLQVSIQLSKLPNISEDILELLLTFSEMMGLFYASENKRSPKTILRLYNLCFRHSLAVNSLLFPVKSMTTRKLQGIYYHQIINHSALIYRLISLKSINAELFERFFDRLEDITKKTWSRQPDDLIPNTFLHVQAEDAMKEEVSAMEKQDKEISRLAGKLPQATNTIIKSTIIKKRSSLWQSHIQRFPDYLKLGPGHWWEWKEDGSVEFFDGGEADDYRESGPHKQHFRSASISSLQKDLQVTWDKMYNNSPHLLPVYKLRDKEGKLHYQRKDNNQGKVLSISS